MATRIIPGNGMIVKPQMNALNTKYIWRNEACDAYKIAHECYADKPLDLTNYLLIRTREQLLLQNRVSGAITNTRGMLSGLRSKLF